MINVLDTNTDYLSLIWTVSFLILFLSFVEYLLSTPKPFKLKNMDLSDDIPPFPISESYNGGARDLLGYPFIKHLKLNKWFFDYDKFELDSEFKFIEYKQKPSFLFKFRAKIQSIFRT